MSGLRFKTGFLTREERLVFLTVSLCLLGGGLFHLALSLFDLPGAIDPRAEQVSPFDDYGRTGTRESEPRRAAEGSAGSEAAGPGESDAGQEETSAGGAGQAGANARGTDGPGLAGKLELNGATQLELEELPGIGPALAKRILQQRARVGGFASVEDLLDVSGIGEKTLSRFRAYVYVSRPRR